jgi:hypothetical protein
MLPPPSDGVADCAPSQTDFKPNRRDPQVAILNLPNGACFMSTTRVNTREFRESAVGLVLSQGLTLRVAAEDLGMP